MVTLVSVLQVGYAAPLLMGASATDGATAERAVALSEWMARYAGGDADAFQALYASLAPRVFGYLCGLIGDRAAAEDALQRTFLRLHAARDGYVRGADPAPWIFTIAHRVALDELRRRRRARVRLAGSDERLPEPRADLAGNPEADAAEPVDERLRVTIELLQRLPENQRAALILTKIEGRTHAEAAAITGATIAAIKLRAHRAYVTLRRLLAEARR